MIILTWFVMAYGFTNIMVYGSIFNKLRLSLSSMGEDIFNPLHGVFKFMSGIITCMMCCSTWIGFFLGLFIFSPVHTLYGIDSEFSWFFDGLLASGAVWAINAIVEWFEENRK